MSDKKKPEEKNIYMTETKIKGLETEMKKAEQEGDEVYLKYLQRIYNNTITVNVNAGGTVIMQSGTPPPPPPYGGG